MWAGTRKKETLFSGLSFFKAHAQSPPRATDVIFYLKLPWDPYYMSANSKGSDDCAYAQACLSLLLIAPVISTLFTCADSFMAFRQRFTFSLLRADSSDKQMDYVKGKSAFENAYIQNICACAKYHSGLCSPFIHFVVANYSVSEQWRSWSDCAHAQADLGLRYPHMPEDTFSHVSAQKIVLNFSPYTK